MGSLFFFCARRRHRRRLRRPRLGGALLAPRPPFRAGSESGERFSRKVFVGGLPPDIDEGSYAHLLSVPVCAMCAPFPSSPIASFSRRECCFEYPSNVAVASCAQPNCASSPLIVCCLSHGLLSSFLLIHSILRVLSHKTISAQAFISPDSRLSLPLTQTACVFAFLSSRRGDNGFVPPFRTIGRGLAPQS